MNSKVVFALLMCVLAGTALAQVQVTQSFYGAGSTTCTGQPSSSVSYKLNACTNGNKFTSCTANGAVATQYTGSADCNTLSTATATSTVTIPVGVCTVTNNFAMLVQCTSSSASTATLSMFALLVALFVAML
jgi:hypothetical protein